MSFGAIRITFLCIQLIIILKFFLCGFIPKYPHARLCFYLLIRSCLVYDTGACLIFQAFCLLTSIDTALGCGNKNRLFSDFEFSQEVQQKNHNFRLVDLLNSGLFMPSVLNLVTWHLQGIIKK